MHNSIDRSHFHSETLEKVWIKRRRYCNCYFGDTGGIKMKKDELTESQEDAYNAILKLCAELEDNTHWFRRDEHKWTQGPTLDALEKKGFLISKYVEFNESWYYQYTGKVYEKPDRCPRCKSLLTATNKMIDAYDCMNCEKKMKYWTEKDKRKICSYF
jgi:hypothetical protein